MHPSARCSRTAKALIVATAAIQYVALQQFPAMMRAGMSFPGVAELGRAECRIKSDVISKQPA
jgi:hypothetical protein